MKDNDVKNLPKVLVIAGSDSGAGAGIQADIKSIAANGAYATTAITSITAQNTLGVQAIYDLPLSIIEAQITSVLSDIGADIIKTGMLSDTSIINLVSAIIEQKKINLVLDPVMVAKGGAKLLKDDAIVTLKQKLLPLAYIITPNIPEAEILAGISIKTPADMEIAARRVISLHNCNAVLLKGGHLPGNELIDILLQKNSKDVLRLKTKKIKTNNTHGTGCSYASAIAAHLAKGATLESAVTTAHQYIQRAIASAKAIGQGHSPIDHFSGFKL